jgi:hypothetical protein
LIIKESSEKVMCACLLVQKRTPSKARIVPDIITKQGENTGVKNKSSVFKYPK